MMKTKTGKKQHTNTLKHTMMEMAQHVSAPLEFRYRELYWVVGWTGWSALVPCGPVTTDTPGVMGEDIDCGGRAGPVATAKEDVGRAGPVARAIGPDVVVLLLVPVITDPWWWLLLLPLM
jgi:hypothetical protein